MIPGMFLQNLLLKSHFSPLNFLLKAKFGRFCKKISSAADPQQRKSSLSFLIYLPTKSRATSAMCSALSPNSRSSAAAGPE